MYSGVRAPLASKALNAQQQSPGVTLHSAYPHRLNFYSLPPTSEITLEEFESWALDRLRVLADIEAAQSRNKSWEEIKTLVGTRMKNWLPLDGGAGNKEKDKQRKKDHYSHFVLKLGFCRSEELRARFLRAETVLFKIRWDSNEPDERSAFVTSLNFGWEEVSAEEKKAFSSKLAAASWLKEANVGDTEFFKVHWTKVSDLIERRRVFLHKGYAYVPRREELSLVLAEFTSRLSKSLELTARSLPRLDDDTRLLPILTHLSNGFQSGITSDYVPSLSASGEAITAEMVPGLAVESFPFCMRNLTDTLKSSHHLKHEGRQQLNLFIKGIGLSVEEALVFWRKAFSNITDDKFNKEYKYNIRHGYGLEGSRKNYSPKNCQQIITGKSPGPGESHGCPFKHFSESSLTTALASTYNLSAPETKEIVNATKIGHYHVACTRLFEIQHRSVGVQRGQGIGDGESVDHPNRYFEASRKIRLEKVKEEEGVKGEKMEVD